jgi:hypothetical protein
MESTAIATDRADQILEKRILLDNTRLPCRLP